MTFRLPLVLAIGCLAGPAQAAEIVLVRAPTVDSEALAARLSEFHTVTTWTAAPMEHEVERAVVEATRSLEAAREAYRELAATHALEAIARGVTAILPHSERPEGLLLLARLQRLRGRVNLYQGEKASAAEAFAAAAEWDSEFSPPVEEWPPEARLAYSDARAQRLRSAPGALSVRVEPDCAELFVDGRSRGIGSTSIRNLAPGLHVLSASCPGFERFGATFEVLGDGALTELSVFLPALPEANAVRARALLDSPASAKQILLGEPFAYVVIVDRSRQVWLRDASGATLLGPRELTEPALPTALQEKIETRESPARGAAAWYERPWVWIVAGAVLAGGTTAAVLAASRDGDETVRLVIGR